MKSLLRLITIGSFSLALVGVAVLLVSDGIHHLQMTPDHAKIGAIPLILIGLSYFSFQLMGRLRGWELAKGLLIGFAFVLWGSEQLMNPCPMVTVMDSMVITVFVVDLAFIIRRHLKRKDKELP